MECPECKKGKIRVFDGIMCSCCHYPLICDECHQCFMVACGPPFSGDALPPEYPMKPNVKMSKLLKIHKLDEEILKMPLLDDFKKKE